MEALSRAAEGIGPVKPGNLYPFKPVVIDGMESKGRKGATSYRIEAQRKRRRSER